MPRPEKPIPDDGGAVADFARELRALRKAASLTYKEMAEHAYYSVSVLSTAAAGRRLPTWEVTAKYVEACGGDVDQWQTRWERAQASAGKSGSHLRPTPRRSTRRRRRTLVAGIVGLCLILVATLAVMRWVQAAPSPIDASGVGLEKPHIKISVMATSDLAPFHLAVNNGYFKEAGFTFDPAKDVVVVQSGTESVDKLVAGEVDIAYSSYTPFFMAQSKGTANIKLVADASSAGPKSTMVVTMPSSRLKSIKDMAGKRVAVTATNTISDLLVMSALKTQGVDWRTIQWVETPFPRMGERLAKGDADAAFLIEPYLTQAYKTIGTVPLFDTATGPTANMPTAGFGANADFVSNNPKTLAAFQKVMQRATDEAKADRGKVEPLLQEFMKIDADTAKLATLLTFQSSLDATRIQRVVDLMLEFGLIKERIDVSQMIAQAGGTG